MARTRWLWLPAEDGRVTPADPVDIPLVGIPFTGTAPGLRTVSAG
jgi:hypothetical protein